MNDALCARLDAGTADRIFYPERGQTGKAARKLCGRCSVRVECLDYAISTKEGFGIWGGLSERERRVVKRERKQVAS